MKIAISTETTADLTKQIIDDNDFKIIAYGINLGDKFCKDGEITTDEILDYVNQTGVLPKTSAINEFQYNEHFENLLKEYDAVIHFTLSSDLSLANSNAVRASKNFKDVYVIDTKSLSTGIALLALYAKKLANQGDKPKDIYNKCLERVPYIQASFELKRLDYLYKGGRCNSLTYFAANVLKIRPQIIVKDGKMISGKKYKGNYAHVVKSYCRDVLEEFNKPDLENVFITYTTADREIIDSVKLTLKDRGFKNIYETRAGGTITSHCGEDCLGILYINDAY